MWLVEAMQYIDYTKDALINDTLVVCAYVQGCGYNDIQSLPIDDYKQVCTLVFDAIKKREQENG